MPTPDAGQNILTRGLPKTGQSIEFVAGDDGTYEAGWWVGRLNINNRVRFIAKTIGGDGIVLDRATGLIWAADGNAAGGNNGALIAWANAIVYANGLNFAGFADWRLPNIKELMSINDYGNFNPSVDDLFTNTAAAIYWSSSTVVNATPYAWYCEFWQGQVRSQDKLNTYNVRCVR